MNTARTYTLFIFALFLLGFVKCKQHAFKKKEPCRIATERNENIQSFKEDMLLIPHIPNIDSFLAKPFHLLDFKKRAKQSHNGGTKVYPYYFKPNYNGFYSSFFMFSHCFGYLGTNKKDTIIKESGIEIITYKQFNKYKEKYIDPTEQLIAYKAHFNNFELPEMAFVGLSTASISKIFGNNYKVQNDVLYFTSLNKVLIFKTEFGKVKWIKYIVLKEPIKELSAQMLAD